MSVSRCTLCSWEEIGPSVAPVWLGCDGTALGGSRGASFQRLGEVSRRLLCSQPLKSSQSFINEGSVFLLSTSHTSFFLLTLPLLWRDSLGICWVNVGYFHLLLWVLKLWQHIHGGLWPQSLNGPCMSVFSGRCKPILSFLRLSSCLEPGWQIHATQSVPAGA